MLSVHSLAGPAWSILLLIGAVGCGGHSSHADDDDTSSPPTPAAVGLSLSLSEPESTTLDFGGRTCPAGGTGEFTYTLGAPRPLGTVASGTMGTSVTCTVTATGRVSAEVSGYDSRTMLRLSLNFAGTLDKSTSAMSTAALQFYSPETNALYVAAPFPECTVGPITTLTKGAVLTDFSCPLLVANDDAMTGCAAQGTLALEYCLTGEEE
jgi:hypothetical protein